MSAQKKERRAEFDHGRILPTAVEFLPLTSIHPSPENNKLYLPVDLGDPGIQAMAKSIWEIGLREPIVITLDNYILSGHRRYAGCRLAKTQGKSKNFDPNRVPCRRE